MTLLTGHIMGPPMCGTGNGRYGDKLLCNSFISAYFLRDMMSRDVTKTHIFFNYDVHVDANDWYVCVCVCAYFHD